MLNQWIKKVIESQRICDHESSNLLSQICKIKYLLTEVGLQRS